jgi:hypothetical protein
MKTVHKHIYWKEEEINGEKKKVPYILGVVKKDENHTVVYSHPEGMPNPFFEPPNLSDARVREDMKKAQKELEKLEVPFGPHIK